MGQMYGAVEFRAEDRWLAVINISSLLLRPCDLYGCLFGVDNFAGYVPLFADRGAPEDLSADLEDKASPLHEHRHPSWALWSELKQVDWDELAPQRDLRVTELELRDGSEAMTGTKWLNDPRWDGVRASLERDPSATVTVGSRRFRRLILKRRDALTDTDFPLLMKLMASLAERFGDDGVRLTVWFD